MAQESQSDVSASNTSSSDESEHEFEVPENFHSINASESLVHEDINADDKELWLFKLPKHMSASSLSNQSIRLGKHSRSPGSTVATIQHGTDSYIVRKEPTELSAQIINAFPTSRNRAKLVLGKPFTRFLSIVQDCAEFQGKKGVKPILGKKRKLENQVLCKAVTS
uniref:Uncharacterized protein AlNc14C38G3303 n=1 Tax=Albugo laibachii Nc14 TaxID=890382 RepID=F0W932_9STRA|nr:conserved hypothetical protein [Albugo laibachii Nc14]|eukprot:CCA17644.1 conserved hypothetical protein [Albugo laibachii Nc14]